MGMDVYIKKYFWVTTLVVIVICSALAATAVGHVIEATALTDSDKPVKRAPVRPPPSAATPDKSKPTKVGLAIAERNMFCSECQPVAPPTDSGPVPSDGSPPITSLPLRVVATNVASNETLSFATVQNTQSNVTGLYHLGDEIPGAGPVVKVVGKYVDFENKSSRRVERISLLGGEAPAPPPTTVAAAEPPPDDGKPKDDLLAAVEAGVKKIDDTTFEIDRSLVDKVLANPTAVARGARVVPSVKNGQPNGFKLYAIRPSSVYAKIGLMNGDTIHAVNGFELTSLDKGLEVYTKVKESTNLSVSITRRGKPLNLSYSIK
ncbi:MAG TPA: type II secretion system protein GspC [Kofleriaceae bacterium]|nr:type II secretion system protein GspC [Kofleriaceae bacterium]